jgi:hypothetical protein
LFQPPECWDYRNVPPHLASSVLFFLGSLGPPAAYKVQGDRDFTHLALCCFGHNSASSTYHNVWGMKSISTIFIE